MEHGYGWENLCDVLGVADMILYWSNDVPNNKYNMKENQEALKLICPKCLLEPGMWQAL